MDVKRLIVDAIIRNKAAMHEVTASRFTIRVARTAEEYASAFRLAQAAYMFQGFERIDAPTLRIAQQHVLPEATVLVAYEGNQCVGTMSITLDSPAHLPLDADYPQEVAALRAEGCRLVEIGSYAIVRRCWGTGVAQLLSIAATRVAFRWMDASHVIIGCNPKAWPMYRALWSFERLGAVREHSNLRAPLIGIVADREKVLRNARRWFSRPMKSGSLVAEHLFEGPPHPCMVGEDRPSDEPMPRAVFQELFLKRTERVAELDDQTLAYLRTRRTDDTLTLVESGSTSAKCTLRQPLATSAARGVLLPFERKLAEGRHAG